MCVISVKLWNNGIAISIWTSTANQIYIVLLAPISAATLNIVLTIVYFIVGIFISGDLCRIFRIYTRIRAVTRSTTGGINHKIIYKIRSHHNTL